MTTPTPAPRLRPAATDLEVADSTQAPEGPSKSQRKRAMHDLQKLGERLLELPAHKVDALALPERLADALRLARRITAHEGRRRQLQFIGRLMRDVDDQAIRAAIEVDDVQHRAETALMHRAERWRDHLLEQPERLTEFVQQHPAAATAGLHTLIRSARTEVARAQRGRHYRELYRVLRNLMAPAPQPVSKAAQPSSDEPQD